MLIFTKKLITTIINISIRKYTILVVITKETENKKTVKVFFKINNYTNYKKLNSKNTTIYSIVIKTKNKFIKKLCFRIFKNDTSYIILGKQ